MYHKGRKKLTRPIVFRIVNDEQQTGILGKIIGVGTKGHTKGECGCLHHKGRKWGQKIGFFASLSSLFFVILKNKEWKVVVDDAFFFVSQ